MPKLLHKSQVNTKFKITLLLIQQFSFLHNKLIKQLVYGLINKVLLSVYKTKENIINKR